MIGLILAPSVMSFNCYECTDCDGENVKSENEKSCEAPAAIAKTAQPTCTKSIHNEKTNYRCSYSDPCDGNPTMNADGVEWYCCQSDLCNSAPVSLPAIALVLAPTLVLL